MTGYINIDRLALWGQHGVMPQENVVGAMFYVTLHIETDISEDALLHDRLEGTVSYADIIDIVRREMAVPSRLLEHLAHRTGRHILDSFRAVRSLTIYIYKENPPCGASADGIGVELRMERENG